MTKKIQNSSISGAVAKPKKEKVAVETITPVETVEVKTDLQAEVATAVDVTATSILDSFDDCAVGMSKSYLENNVGRTALEITDEPVVTVAGKRITLKESKGPENFFSGNPYGFSGSLLVSGDSSWGHRTSSRFDVRDVAKFKEGWWECTLGGVTVYLTRGSELYVPDHLSSNDWDYEEINKVTPSLVLIGSSIETDSLNVSGKNVLNNTSINISGGYVNLKKSKITTTALSGKGSVEINRSTLTGVIYFNSDNVGIYDSKITSVTFNGFKRIDLRKVTTRSDSFVISGWGYGNSVLPDLYIADVSLTGFDGVFQQLTPEISSYKDLSRPHAVQFNINRRVDYGHFSAKQPVPFIRLGALDLVVGGEIFKASEFFPTPSTDVYPVVKDVTQVQDFGFRPGYPRYDLPVVSNTGSTYRGSMLWNRAAKVIFGWNYGKTPIGVSGENLVNALIEQIKSRISLYVEFNNLSE